jgi:DNA-binding CsgD family transcriptional regulator
METPCSAAAAEARTLQALTSRADYAGRISEVVQKIPSAEDEAEAVSLLAEATARLGMDAGAFVSFIRGDGSFDSFRFLLACDPVWCLEYRRRAWFAHDPWLEYALHNSEPAPASEIPLGGKHQHEVAKLAAEFGFRSALIVPAPSSGGRTRVGVLCLGSSMQGFVEADGYEALTFAARSLAMELHEWWIRQIKRELIRNAGITEEDLVLLKLEHLGHGTKAIAAELNTSTSSVDSRFQRVNQKLVVPNRKAAAKLAADYGLI